MAATVLGLDIGGANLKAAHSSGTACLRPFALWKSSEQLTDALSQLLRDMPPHDLLALTMTGELCDCFESKRQGVHAILDAVEAAAAAVPIRVWRTDECFVNLEMAKAEPLLVAAANWQALATFCGRFAPSGSALVVDIGSTTSDIIPLHNGKPVPRGRTDPERLKSRELAYTGVRRTPVCAILGARGAAEVFATTHDVYLLLGDIKEDAGDCETADGRPATKAAAQARLARMLCADGETCSAADLHQLAKQIHARQVRVIRQAVNKVSRSLREAPRRIVLTGSGEFLAQRALDFPPALTSTRISLTRTLGSTVSAAACAYALAILAVERGHDA
jgi:probable H4MPT-linked C1 transfer pathway protein